MHAWLHMDDDAACIIFCREGLHLPHADVQLDSLTGKKAGDEGLREGVQKLRDEGHTVDVRAQGLLLCVTKLCSMVSCMAPESGCVSSR